MKIIIAYIGIDDIFNISASLQRGKEDLGFTLHFAILHQQMKDKERNEEWWSERGERVEIV